MMEQSVAKLYLSLGPTQINLRALFSWDTVCLNQKKNSLSSPILNQTVIDNYAIQNKAISTLNSIKLQHDPWICITWHAIKTMQKSKLWWAKDEKRVEERRPTWRELNRIGFLCPPGVSTCWCCRNFSVHWGGHIFEGSEKKKDSPTEQNGLNLQGFYAKVKTER